MRETLACHQDLKPDSPPAHVELTQRLARSAETKWNEESALVEHARNDGRACLPLSSPLSSRVVVRARRVAGHTVALVEPADAITPASRITFTIHRLRPMGERRDEQLLSAAGLA